MDSGVGEADRLLFADVLPLNIVVPSFDGEMLESRDAAGPPPPGGAPSPPPPVQGDDSKAAGGGGPDWAKMAEVRAWLRPLGLEQYAAQFEEEGYDDLQVCC